MEILKKVLSKDGISINYTLNKIGNNFSLTIGGGEEHIGCVILAVPRPSLDNVNEIKSTVSILNVVNHKDDEVAKPLAEELCIVSNKPAVVIAGIHFDCLTIEGIGIIKDINKEAVKKLKDWILEIENR